MLIDDDTVILLIKLIKK